MTQGDDVGNGDKEFGTTRSSQMKRQLLDRWGFELPDLTDKEKAELASQRASYRKPTTPWMTTPDDLFAELAEEPAAVIRGALEER